MKHRLMAAALLVCAAGSAQAERYRVDLIVFADKTGVADEAPVALQVPNLKGAVEPFDAQALLRAGIEMLPDDQFALTEAWNHLRNSRNHQPLMRLCWLQRDPPAERGTSLHLHYGTPLSNLAAGGTVFPVDGTVALLAGRFLHLDTDLVATQPGAAGDLTSYRLHEKRRLRRDELHHLDSPTLGVLVRVTRADVPPKAVKKAKKK